MESNEKDRLLGFVGVGLAAAGILLFLLSYFQVFDGAMYLMGFFFGVSLVLCGLIMAFVYFWRYGRIRRLFRGDTLLANWSQPGRKALISARNAYVDGVLYEWAIPGTRLDDARVVPAAGDGASGFLEISLSEGHVTRGGLVGQATTVWHPSTISVRIPKGQEETAGRIADELLKHKHT